MSAGAAWISRNVWSKERRARLAAERLLEQKSRELFAANEKLALHARSLSDQIVEQRQVVRVRPVRGRGAEGPEQPLRDRSGPRPYRRRHGRTAAVGFDQHHPRRLRRVRRRPAAGHRQPRLSGRLRRPRPSPPASPTKRSCAWPADRADRHRRRSRRRTGSPTCSPAGTTTRSNRWSLQFCQRHLGAAGGPPRARRRHGDAWRSTSPNRCASGPRSRRSRMASCFSTGRTGF